MTFHSVGNGIIIPTVTQSIIFQRGWLAQPPTSICWEKEQLLYHCFFISFFNGDIMGIARRMGKFSHELWVFRSAGKSSNYGWWMFQQAT